MIRPLTKLEKRQVRQALEGAFKYTHLSQPVQWHQFVLHWNWDDGFEPLRWIIRQKDCDQGTALLIYWRAAPGWFCSYRNREDIIANKEDINHYDFIKEIEAKYMQNFYMQRSIQYNPKDDDGQDRTLAYRDRPWKQDIPLVMTLTSPGDIVQRENLFEGILRPLNEREINRTCRRVDNGFSIITEHQSLVDSASQPIDVVTAIFTIVERYRAHADIAEQLSNNHPLMNLGWTWCDQLCRAYNWTWKCWEVGNTKSIGVFSQDNLFASFSPNLISYTLNVKTRKNKVRDLFEQLGRVQHTQELSEAYALGWVVLKLKAW